MYEIPKGILIPSGILVGGHCLTAIGFYTSHEDLDGDAGILLQNSWGKEGFALIRVNDLNKLLLQDGEAGTPASNSLNVVMVDNLFSSLTPSCISYILNIKY